MSKRNRVVIAGLAFALVLTAPACVGKKLFRKNVETTDTRITDVETAVEENERRLSDLATETDSRIAAVAGKAEQAVSIGNEALGTAKRADVTAQEAKKGRLLWTVRLSDDRVKFGFDKAMLSDEAKRELDGLASQIKNLAKAVYLEIEGHTDNIGSEPYNLELGQRRAMTVLRYLNEAGGIPLHAMNVVSLGSSKPIADNRTKDGRAQNRRVVIRVLE